MVKGSNVFCQIKYHGTKTKKIQIYSTKFHQKQIIFHFSYLVPVLNPIKTCKYKKPKKVFFIVCTDTKTQLSRKKKSIKSVDVFSTRYQR
jgi:hypothetical protein